MASNVLKFQKPKKKKGWSLWGVPFGKPVATLFGACFVILFIMRYAALHGAPADAGLDRTLVVIMALCVTYVFACKYNRS